MEHIEAELVENEVVLKEIKYPVTQSDLDALLEEYKDIPNIDPESDEAGEQYQFVLKGHKAFVKARNGIEKTRKQLKEPALSYGKKVDEIAKEFQAQIKGTEDKLKIERLKVEENEARKQREAEEREEQRIKDCKRVIIDIQNKPLECVGKNSQTIKQTIESLEVPTEETVNEFLDEAIEAYKQTMQQLETMYEQQVLVDKAEEIQKQKELEAQKLEDERNAKLQAEREEFERQQAEFRAQREAFEAEQNAIKEEEAHKQAEREADELMQKQEQERKELEAENARLREHKIAETLEAMNKYSDNGLMLNEIIAGAIPNLKWEM